jgi:hypothetical protein
MATAEAREPVVGPFGTDDLATMDDRCAGQRRAAAK